VGRDIVPIKLEFFVQTRYQVKTDERIPPQIEEVVIDPDLGDAQQVTPDSHNFVL
jgi:hypothetical protein